MQNTLENEWLTIISLNVIDYSSMESLVVYVKFKGHQV